MEIESLILYEAIRRANDLGHYGKRVIGIEVIPAESASGRDNIDFILDNGPQSASQSWEQR